MENPTIGKKLTVQGLITPVPAALGSVQAGYQSSRSNDCNDTPVSLAGVSDNVTSNENGLMGSQLVYEADPFRRSAKVLRSPQKTRKPVAGEMDETPKNSQTRSIGTVIRDHLEEVHIAQNLRGKSVDNPKGATNDTPKNDQDRKGFNGRMMIPSHSSPRQEFILKMRCSEEETMENCQKVLKKMRQAISRQKNIARDVQDGVSELEELLDVMKDYRRNWKNAEKEKEKEKESRRLVLENSKNSTEKAVEGTTSRPLSQSKRTASSPAEVNPNKKPRSLAANDPETPSHKKRENSKNTKSPNKVSRSTTEKRKIKKPKVRPDAVIIRPNEGHSYAEVLRNIKSKVRPEEAEVAVRGIRKTIGGSILLEMERGGNQEKFRETIKDILKGEAEVNGLKPRATLEIRDLDSLSTEEEVIAAINRATKTKEIDISVRLTATNKLEQKRAFVTLPLDAVQELLKTARIKIGWTNCRIRLKEEIKRCYRCFGSGHLQRVCRGTDRSGMGLCIKCGEKGHKLKECKNPPRCCICTEAGKRQVDHLPGTRSCKTEDEKAR